MKNNITELDFQRAVKLTEHILTLSEQFQPHKVQVLISAAVINNETITPELSTAITRLVIAAQMLAKLYKEALIARN